MASESQRPGFDNAGAEAQFPRRKTTLGMPAAALATAATGSPESPTTLEPGTVRAGVASNTQGARGVQASPEQQSSILLRADAPLRQTNWRALTELLSDAEGQSPGAALLLAVAQKELGQDAGVADLAGTQAMARLLGVPTGHSAAFVLARRILRLKPNHKPQQALSNTSSIVVLIMSLTCGVIGFFAARSLETLRALVP